MLLALSQNEIEWNLFILKHYSLRRYAVGRRAKNNALVFGGHISFCNKMGEQSVIY